MVFSISTLSQKITIFIKKGLDKSGPIEYNVIRKKKGETTMDFFTNIETEQQNKLASCMNTCTNPIELQPNQRIIEDRRTHTKWLEEKQRFKAGGTWHRCWVRIAQVN